MVSKTVVGIAAGIAGTLFLGYCIYFDRKRRNNPLFKQKLKEKRERQKKEQNAGSDTSPTTVQLPDLNDPEKVQKFFLAQVQLGEELLAQGDFESGTECLCNAVAVCGQPEHLLQVLQKTLPPQVFDMLVQKIPAASQRVSAAMIACGSSARGASGILVEEELE